MPKKQKPFQLPAAAYDTVPRAQITLTDETMWLTKFDPRGAPNVTHPVAARDVARAFNLFGQTTGLLPADCLFWTATAAQARLGICPTSPSAATPHPSTPPKSNAPPKHKTKKWPSVF